MPIIKSAKKKMRQDKVRNKRNDKYLDAYKIAVKKVKSATTKTKIVDLVKLAYSKIDKAVKKRVIHKNKAARLKAAMAKFLSPKKTKTKNEI